MSGFSSTTADNVLNLVLRREAFTPPAVYLALFTSDAGLENNTPAVQTEVIGGGYARVNTADWGGFSSSINGSTTNVADMDFPMAISDWGVVTHIAVMDSQTGGNVLVWGQLVNPRTIYNGDSIRVRTGAIVITLE